MKRNFFFLTAVSFHFVFSMRTQSWRSPCNAAFVLVKCGPIFLVLEFFFFVNKFQVSDLKYFFFLIYFNIATSLLRLFYCFFSQNQCNVNQHIPTYFFFFLLALLVITAQFSQVGKLICAPLYSWLMVNQDTKH